MKVNLHVPISNTFQRWEYDESFDVSSYADALSSYHFLNHMFLLQTPQIRNFCKTRARHVII